VPGFFIPDDQIHDGRSLRVTHGLHDDRVSCLSAEDTELREMSGIAYPWVWQDSRGTCNCQVSFQPIETRDNVPGLEYKGLVTLVYSILPCSRETMSWSLHLHRLDEAQKYSPVSTTIANRDLSKEQRWHRLVFYAICRTRVIATVLVHLFVSQKDVTARMP